MCLYFGVSSNVAFPKPWVSRLKMLWFGWFWYPDGLETSIGVCLQSADSTFIIGKNRTTHENLWGYRCSIVVFFLIWIYLIWYAVCEKIWLAPSTFSSKTMFRQWIEWRELGGAGRTKDGKNSWDLTEWQSPCPWRLFIMEMYKVVPHS